MYELELLASAFETSGLVNTFPLPEESDEWEKKSSIAQPLPEPTIVCVIGGCSATCSGNCFTCLTCATKQNG